MDSAAKVISALASLAWPLVIAVLLYKLYSPIRTLVESARARKFTIKVAGNELTMEEASEQQRSLLADVQTKLAELEKRMGILAPAEVPRQKLANNSKRILWVDDEPKNNSFLVASIEDRGVRVDTALSTEEALGKLKSSPYDIVISDMGRPEGKQAGIELTHAIKDTYPKTPVYIFCGKWAATNLRAEALAAGAKEITSSGTTLLSALLL